MGGNAYYRRHTNQYSKDRTQLIIIHSYMLSSQNGQPKRIQGLT